MPGDDLDNRFGYHRPADDTTIHRHQLIRVNARNLAGLIDSNVPDGREKSLALTALEEAMFWANAGIARLTPAGERKEPTGG